MDAGPALCAISNVVLLEVAALYSYGKSPGCDGSATGIVKGIVSGENTGIKWTTIRGSGRLTTVGTEKEDRAGAAGQKGECWKFGE
jgi:hypothetical protein